MIEIENITENMLRITASGELKAEDFAQVAPQADALIKKYGTLRLLLDGSGLNGWEDMAALEKHMDFVKTHHQHVERIALIAGHSWQHWLAGMIKVFVHPEIRIFDKNKVEEAQKWLKATE